MSWDKKSFKHIKNQVCKEIKEYIEANTKAIVKTGPIDKTLACCCGPKTIAIFCG